MSVQKSDAKQKLSPVFIPPQMDLSIFSSVPVLALENILLSSPCLGTASIVCKSWRDTMFSSASFLASAMVVHHGEAEALLRAVRVWSRFPPRMANLVHEVLKLGAHADTYGGEALVHASASGDEVIVRLLLEWPETASPADCQDGTALVQAAAAGHEAIVRLLLEWPQHAPPADCQDGEALDQAAAAGHEAIVRLLLEQLPEGDWYYNPLNEAAASGHEAVVRLLLEWPGAPEAFDGAEFQDGAALLHAAEAGHEAVVRLLLEEWPQEEHPTSDSPVVAAALRQAASNGHVAAVLVLLDFGAQCSNGRALLLAAKYGHEAVVRALLTCRGYDYCPRVPGWEASRAPFADCMNGRVLVKAASRGHESVVALLLSFHYAAPKNGHERIVRLLLECPRDAPRADCQGGMALVRAAERGHEEVVRLLLDWPVHAPLATSLQGRAFVGAEEHPGILRLLHMSLARALAPVPVTVTAAATAAGAVAEAAAAGEVAAEAIDKGGELMAGTSIGFLLDLKLSEFLAESEIKSLAQSMASVAAITLSSGMVTR